MTLETFIDFLQWPAMVATLIAAWLVGSRQARKRNWGFLCFILSNALWIIWGVQAHAWALITLQVGLFLMNLRGTKKNAAAEAEADTPARS
ncbi:hypothetical protein KEM63_02255 [Halopseudomonas nanhaiensis]|uniref:hypothetical protein n=1 Tax=Halopseudomonas nanhaiensis TaxID=2830842 RepID=UPI001CBB69BF|nr:hypothetical protein [Halopseudomonas nanhaiensis]UAW98832.1 hypothetical protein KEM63_02255 [Halopseudomonas nanhaiensis]